MSDNQEKIQFLEYQKPGLEAGNYRTYKIEVRQELKVGENEYFFPQKDSQSNFQYKELNFAVLGERFSLDPAAIHVMFPPPGSLGRHTDCLPHISIKRSTLPWERSAYGNEDYEPWLALLLFDEEEIKAEEVKQRIITLEDLSGYLPHTYIIIERDNNLDVENTSAQVLFTIEKTDWTLYGSLDDSIKAKFAENNHALSDSAAIFPKKWQITGDPEYIIIERDNNLDVENTDADVLFTIEKTDWILYGSLDESIKAKFAENNRALSDNATISPVHWKISEPKFPEISLELGQNPDDKVMVVDVKKSLLEKIMPSGEELKMLAHVRKRVNGDENAPETELAVIVGNRLPREGADSSAYLVSLEGRYKDDDKAFDYQGADDEDYIRLVSLKNWSFACLPEEGKNFEELVEDIDTGVFRSPLRSPKPYGATLELKLDKIVKTKGRVLDSSGNGHVCSIHGQIVPDDVFGNCLSFDGINDYILAEGFQWENKGAVTVAFWAKIEALSAGQSVIFTIEPHQDSSDIFQAYFSWLDKSLCWEYGSADGEGGESICADNLTCLDEWTHVALVSKGKDDQGNDGEFMGIYINGEIAASAALSKGPDMALEELRIAESGNEDHFLKGKLRDFRIYNRALSHEEIRLSHSVKKPAKYLSMGYVPLPHTLRQCDKTCSWYHGPLAPQAVNAAFQTDDDLPDFGDALIRYHKDIGMFDVSYAAAFELGRSLALEDNLFASALYQWKYNYNEKVCADLQKTDADKLVGPASDADEAPDDAPETNIKNRFKELAMLKNVPFNYLVPDEEMLPAESIRFFKLDKRWVECLLYGAFTVGGRVRTDDGGDRIDLFKMLSGKSSEEEEVYSKTRSGFIVRSELVLDYPDLLADAYSETKLANVRVERLGPEIMLCLFEGDVDTGELYLKPEGLRFGLDEESGALKKELRTEYIFNAVNNHLPVKIADEDAATMLKDIKNEIADLEEDPYFHSSYFSLPQDSGAKFEFPVVFKHSEKRILDLSSDKRDIEGEVSGIFVSLKEIIKKMALRMTGKEEFSEEEKKDEYEYFESVTPAQIGMHMLEGANKGKFTIKAEG